MEWISGQSKLTLTMIYSKFTKSKWGFVLNDPNINCNSNFRFFFIFKMRWYPWNVINAYVNLELLTLNSITRHESCILIVKLRWYVWNDRTKCEIFVNDHNTNCNMNYDIHVSEWIQMWMNGSKCELWVDDFKTNFHINLVFLL